MALTLRVHLQNSVSRLRLCGRAQTKETFASNRWNPIKDSFQINFPCLFLFCNLYYYFKGRKNRKKRKQPFSALHINLHSSHSTISLIPSEYSSHAKQKALTQWQFVGKSCQSIVDVVLLKWEMEPTDKIQWSEGRWTCPDVLSPVPKVTIETRNGKWINLWLPMPWNLQFLAGQKWGCRLLLLD